MTKIYIAGSLFNEAEVKQRMREGTILRQEFKDISIFNPIEQPFNEDKSTLPTPQDIYKGDTAAIDKADIIIADVSNPLDSGIFWELGYAAAKGITIIAVNSDIRLATANQYSIPSISMNHYVLGGILESDGMLVKNFEEAIEVLRCLGVK